MERRSIPESENKLIILYALRLLGPCTSGQLLQFMVETDIMNYFSLQLSLCEMEEQGQIKGKAHPLGTLLAPTEAGEYTLSSFEHLIPHSRRGMMEQSALFWRPQFRLEQQTPVESCVLPDGQLCIHVRLLDGDAPMLDIMLSLPQGVTFPLLDKRWRKSAQAVFDAVVHTLTMDDGADEENVPEDAGMLKTGSGDWRVTLTHRGGGMVMTMVLTLPTEELALCSLRHWQGAAEQLRVLLMEELAKAI